MDDGREYVEANGLMLSAVNGADSWWLAAADVAKTLKSATSADLPVEQVTKVDLGHCQINLRTCTTPVRRAILAA
jgi:hypothetical protein